MPPRCGNFRRKKVCEREYHPGGGPAGPPHRPQSLTVFKILAAPLCATTVRRPLSNPTMVEIDRGLLGPPSAPCVADQWSGFPAFHEGPPRPKFVKITTVFLKIALENSKNR